MSGHHLEVDDDLLLDNAAAASMLSPTLCWVNKSRSRVQRRTPGAQRGAGGPSPVVGPPGSGGGGAAVGEDADADDGEDLEMEDEAAEQESMEQLKEDLQRLAALEEMYTKLKLQNAVLEQQLMGIYSAVRGVLDENRCMKRLLSLLQVRRGDFVPDEPQQGDAAGQPEQAQQAQPDQQQQGQGGDGEGQQAVAAEGGAAPQAAQHAEQQQQQQAQLDQEFLERVGRRLIGNLHRVGAAQQTQLVEAARHHHFVAPPPQQQRQAPAAGAAAAEGGAPPSPPLAHHPNTPNAKASPVALAADSPRVPAYRGAMQYGGFWFPQEAVSEEAQVAAAVLATTGGDASAALATLLDHAIAARPQQLGPQQQE